MDQHTKSALRNDVTEWVNDRYPEATEIAPHSGQRFVFRTAGDSVIKLWPPADAVEMERCRREVDLLLNNDIAGLPKIAVGLADTTIAATRFTFYEERWIDSSSLRDYVSREGATTELGVAVLFEGARILADLHSIGVVHRDVSWGNLLIGPEHQIYIVDLGLAKYVSLETLTATHEQLGMTPLFASPEQLTSASSGLGPPTDVYSLALVASYGASGRFAFIDEPSRFDPRDYLARMAHVDVVDASVLFHPAISEMLNPIAPLRPTAAHISEQGS